MGGVKSGREDTSEQAQSRASPVCSQSTSTTTTNRRYERRSDGISDLHLSHGSRRTISQIYDGAHCVFMLPAPYTTSKEGSK
jgi:hypothetical protein